MVRKGRIVKFRPISRLLVGNFLFNRTFGILKKKKPSNRKKLT